MALTALFILATSTYSLPPGLLSALCYVESGHKAEAIRPNDGGSASRGVCQMKLATARSLGYKGPPSGLLKPSVNIDLAGKYLAFQIRRYHGDYARAVTAYNRGRSEGHGGTEYLAKVFNQWIRNIQDGREALEDGNRWVGREDKVGRVEPSRSPR